MAKKVDIRKRFGERVRTLRKNRGISQATLAEACDLDRTYIVDIERGNRNVGLLNIEKLAVALDVSLSWLFRPL
jgi:transcriptional regulator with XRE-family HTH domain